MAAQQAEQQKLAAEQFEKFCSLVEKVYKTADGKSFIENMFITSGIFNAGMVSPADGRNYETTVAFHEGMREYPILVMNALRHKGLIFGGKDE